MKSFTLSTSSYNLKEEVRLRDAKREGLYDAIAKPWILN